MNLIYRSLNGKLMRFSFPTGQHKSAHAIESPPLFARMSTHGDLEGEAERNVEAHLRVVQLKLYLWQVVIVLDVQVLKAAAQAHAIVGPAISSAQGKGGTVPRGVRRAMRLQRSAVHPSRDERQDHERKP
eukprot:CAMPEP_0179454370 /NCGR_PEP_ID=MMETSP0799-20121207/38221_1 /TAXON_ID=46947 /ORGANISM="Geminigera cryophila, Strain CCMP2564" /LENGTH=129 /DNA_ID=CAMNT_0021252155 /DNA_START=110 /DNA_END=495 /DNA_ORIENTATION=-